MQTFRRTLFNDHPSLLALAATKTHAFTTGLRRRPPGHFIWHYHPEIQLVWTWRGHGLRYVGNSIERFEPGDLVLIGANLPHMWAAADTEAISTVIHFLPERWGAELWRLPELQKLRRLLAAAARGLCFTGAEAWKTGRAIDKLASRSAHDLGSLIRFLEICERLTCTPCSPLNSLAGKAATSPTDPRLDQILEWVQSHAAEHITQEQAAAQVGMSPAAFSRWFKRYVGCVFHCHLNQLRVAMVCARLSRGQESITEAAFQCGYNNLANFNRRFREITGLTPSEFRLSTRRMQQDLSTPFTMGLGTNGSVHVTTPTPKANGRPPERAARQISRT